CRRGRGPHWRPRAACRPAPAAEASTSPPPFLWQRIVPMGACRARLSRAVRLGVVVVVCWCRYNYGSSAGQSWMENIIHLTAYRSRVVNTGGETRGSALNGWYTYCNQWY